jgi:high frequency lysogenization protein
MSGQVLALAGVFQATELVRQAANHGTWSGYAATTCLDSLFRLEAATPAEIYGGREQLKLGLESMVSILGGEGQAETLQQVAGLLQLQGKFLRNARLQHEVGKALEQIAASASERQQHERQDLQATEIAELYTRTISNLTPRIVVHGRPQYLQNERTVSWIRTLLFAGLRSAVLWRQMGGGRWSLLTGRRRLLTQAQELLHG